MTELLIRRGRVVNADGAREADVRIVGSTIYGIGVNLKPSDGARVIDASGQLVLPGGVDPHTHLSPAFVDDLTSGSMAALAGGITTLGTFGTDHAPWTREQKVDPSLSSTRLRPGMSDLQFMLPMCFSEGVRAQTSLARALRRDHLDKRRSYLWFVPEKRCDT